MAPHREAARSRAKCTAIAAVSATAVVAAVVATLVAGGSVASYADRPTRSPVLPARAPSLLAAYDAARAAGPVTLVDTHRGRRRVTTPRPGPRSEAPSAATKTRAAVGPYASADRFRRQTGRAPATAIELAARGVGFCDIGVVSATDPEGGAAFALVVTVDAFRGPPADALLAVARTRRTVMYRTGGGKVDQVSSSDGTTSVTLRLSR